MIYRRFTGTNEGATQGSAFFFNHLFGKKELRRCVQWLILFGGFAFTTTHMDKLKSLGFSYSTRSGLSLGVDDLLIPTEKYKFIYVIIYVILNRALSMPKKTVPSMTSLNQS